MLVNIFGKNFPYCPNRAENLLTENIVDKMLDSIRRPMPKSSGDLATVNFCIFTALTAQRIRVRELATNTNAILLNSKNSLVTGRKNKTTKTGRMYETIS